MKYCVNHKYFSCFVVGRSYIMIMVCPWQLLKNDRAFGKLSKIYLKNKLGVSVVMRDVLTHS